MILLLGVGAVFTITVALDSMAGSLGSRAVCHVDGAGGQVRLSPEQMGNAALITGVGMEMGVGERAITIALATAMQESSLRNLNYGDRDSLGLFQQRPSQGWGTPEQVQDRVYATKIFFNRLLEVNFEEMELTEAAQTVQISAFPRAYAKHEPLATALTATFTGAAPRSLSCHLQESEGLNPRTLIAELGQAHPGATTIAQGEGIMLGGEVNEWALAHWLIATAEHTGVSTVDVAGMAWTRASGWQESSDVLPGIRAR